MFFSFIRKKYPNTTFSIPFIVLSGSYLNQVLFFDSNVCRGNFESLYVDNFGIPDSNFSRNKELFLSETQIEKLVEFILTSNV
jgi:hypothetical protein